MLGKLKLFEGKSNKVLRTLDGLYDFIYVDASRSSWDCLSDGLLSWDLLKIGGIMAFDGYTWAQKANHRERPKIGIDAFLNVHGDHLTVLQQDAQVWIQKNG